jgi:hypothetical protein
MKATDMADGDLRDQIARLEADIEQLAETLDRCRKAMALAKVAIAAGGVLILAYFLGAIGFDPAILIGALAAIIGGVVVFGSNSSTSLLTARGATPPDTGHQPVRHAGRIVAIAGQITLQHPIFNYSAPHKQSERDWGNEGRNP